MNFGGGSSVAEFPLFQGEDGGAIPTPSLQNADKNLKGWMVERCLRKHIEPFIERWHYSKSIKGCTTHFCYRLVDGLGKMAGGLFYGPMAMAGQWKRFSTESEKVIELRRLCCRDETPKNAESFFISKSLKLLKKDWRKDGIVVSYADKEYGHCGTIYKASNFANHGEIAGASVIVWKEKRYHDKSLRNKYNNQPKPFARRLADAIKSGEAKYHKTKGKVVYVFDLGRGAKR